MANTIKKIGVLTSGGDAPGMNAAIRAVTRSAIVKGWDVVGVKQGYLGVVNAMFQPLGARDVGGIISRGGTMLGSARCKEFYEEAGQLKGIENMRQAGIDALVVIGGNGSQTGAYKLHMHGFPVVGVASTIDNDLYGSDITIGVDTALDVALENIDRIKTTASSHRRAFLVEVMGRDCGYLALRCGIAGGADVITIPEIDMEPEEIVRELQDAYSRGKTHALAVVAEGAKWNAYALEEYCAAKREAGDISFNIRATILGHIQRGGTPGAYDRYLATIFGAHAVEVLEQGEHGVLVGLRAGELHLTPHEEVVTKKEPLDLKLLELAHNLAY